MALPEELDEWIQRQNKSNRDHLKQQLKELQASLAEVMAENRALRAQFENSHRRGPERGHGTQASIHAIERSAQLREDVSNSVKAFAETIEMSRNYWPYTAL